MERDEVVEYVKRDDSDSEFDEVGYSMCSFRKYHHTELNKAYI